MPWVTTTKTMRGLKGRENLGLDEDLLAALAYAADLARSRLRPSEA